MVELEWLLSVLLLDKLKFSLLSHKLSFYIKTLKTNQSLKCLKSSSVCQRGQLIIILTLVLVETGFLFFMLTQPKCCVLTNNNSTFKINLFFFFVFHSSLSQALNSSKPIGTYNNKGIYCDNVNIHNRLTVILPFCISHVLDIPSLK